MNNKCLKTILLLITCTLLVSLTSIVSAKKRCTVTYKTSSGTFSNKQNLNKKQIKIRYKKGKKRGYAPSIKKNNYVSKGWYSKKKGGKKYTSKTRITHSVKLYPHWLKRYRIKTKYFDYLGYIFKTENDINKCFPNSKLISRNTKYYPFKYKYKSGSFICSYDCDFDDELDKNTYEYSLDTFNCPIKKIVNIKKKTKYSTFLHRLTGSKQTEYRLNRKKHTITFAYKTFKYFDEESKTTEEYYVLWTIKLDKKNRVKPSSKASFTDSEDNIVS